MFARLTIPQPYSGPHGEPFCVKARFGDRIEVNHYQSEREAMDARDAAFDRGAHAVHVRGVPAVITCAVPDGEPVLPEVED